MKRQLTCLLLLLFFICCRNTEPAKKADPIEHKTDTPVTRKKAAAITLVETKVSESLFPDEIDMDNIQKATISKSDSIIRLTANMRLDHRIIGYNKPDTNSEKMILLSIFTRDVKDNPLKCSYGAYYSTNDMENAKLKYLEDSGSFVKASLIKDDQAIATIYFEKAWVEFD
jgi:hypothetical protein